MESLGRFPRVFNVLPKEKIEGPQGIFLRRTQGHIQGQTKGQKPEGQQAPRDFGLEEDVARVRL